MKVLVLGGGRQSDLGPLPSGVEVVAHPAPDVEFAVLVFQSADRLSRLFATMPRLRVIQSLSAGVDWLVPHAPQGVVVCKAVGVHDAPVAEWVIAVMLAVQRRLPTFIDNQRRAEWDRTAGDDALAPALEGQTMVIVGHGSIGRALASRLRPFGVRVTGVALHPREDAEPISALPQLLTQADVVVDLLPLTSDTERFVNGAFLARMKPGALFVNAGRGRTVDTQALVEALRAGHIQAALDVTDPEPLPPGHPLWREPNVLITPHIGGAVARWQERGYHFAGEQIRRYVAGEPLLGVDATVRNTPSA